MLTWIITAPVLLLIGRGGLQAAMATRAGGAYLARNVAIVGAGNEGQRLIARLREEQDKSVVICGIFDDRYSIPEIMTHLKSRRRTTLAAAPNSETCRKPQLQLLLAEDSRRRPPCPCAAASCEEPTDRRRLLREVGKSASTYLCQFA
jgi:hypothetical protein